VKGRIAIVGPSASGKTALAVEIAKAYGGELINADSRQVLSNVAVGTGKPIKAELDGVRCHCLDLWRVGESYTVADWLLAARSADDDIQERGRMTILVGGTGLYVTSFVDGFRESDTIGENVHRDARNRAVERGRAGELVAELKRRDPQAAGTIDLDNPRRVIRALELLDEGWSSVADASRRDDPRPALILGLDPPKGPYRETVTARVVAMFGSGLIAEVETLLAEGVGDEAIRDCGIGYGEALEVVKGSKTTEEAIDATVGRTLKYAKAQRTWWRRDPRVRWADPKDDPKQTFAW
jgi:tRNA dimethylallyltransferase